MVVTCMTLRSLFNKACHYRKSASRSKSHFADSSHAGTCPGHVVKRTVSRYKVDIIADGEPDPRSSEIELNNVDREIMTTTCISILSEKDGSIALERDGSLALDDALDDY